MSFKDTTLLPPVQNVSDNISYQVLLKLSATFPVITIINLWETYPPCLSTFFLTTLYSTAQLTSQPSPLLLHDCLMLTAWNSPIFCYILCSWKIEPQHAFLIFILLFSLSPNWLIAPYTFLKYFWPHAIDELGASSLLYTFRFCLISKSQKKSLPLCEDVPNTQKWNSLPLPWTFFPFFLFDVCVVLGRELRVLHMVG
jgi:hypothetical protein